MWISLCGEHNTGRGDARLLALRVERVLSHAGRSFHAAVVTSPTFPTALPMHGPGLVADKYRGRRRCLDGWQLRCKESAGGQQTGLVQEFFQASRCRVAGMRSDDGRWQGPDGCMQPIDAVSGPTEWACYSLRSYQNPAGLCKVNRDDKLSIGLQLVLIHGSTSRQRNERIQSTCKDLQTMKL